MNISTDVKDLMKCFYTNEEFIEQKKLFVEYLNKRKIRMHNKNKKEELKTFLNSNTLDDFLKNKFNECLRQDFSIFVNNDTFNDDEFFTQSLLYSSENEFLIDCKERKSYSNSYLVDFIKKSDMFNENLKKIIERTFIDCKSVSPNKIDVEYLFMKLRNIDIENYNYTFINKTVTEFDPLDNVFRINDLTSVGNITPGICLSNDISINSIDSEISSCKMDFMRIENNSINYQHNDEVFQSMTNLNEDTSAIFKSYKEHDNRNPTNKELNDIKLLLANKQSLIQIIRSHIKLTDSEHFKGIVDSFEHVFERPISIYEFQKYYNDSMFWKDHSNKIFNDYYVLKKDEYSKAVAITKNIYKIFLGETVDEFYMLKNHWCIFDVADYDKLLIEYMTKQSGYDNIMRECIQDIYTKQYETELELYDMEYVLYHVKSKQLHTKSDELNIIINDIYIETQQFKDLIKGVFDKILNRLPDRLEVKEYVSKFRKDLSNTNEFAEETTVEDIQRELYNNIEYNDVLKKNIISIGNNELLPSQVNNLMNKVLNWDTNNNLKMDINLLTDFVKQEINNIYF